MRRARTQVERVGGEIALTRAQHGWSQRELSRRAGVSPDTERRIERGDPAIQVDTLCMVGGAVGLDIVVQAYPGRQPSLRDTGQLLIAEHLVKVASASWEPALEVTAGSHGEAIDVGFFGSTEILDAEIDRLITDFQRQHRRNVQKRDWLSGQHRRPVRLVMVLEDTERNRAALAPHAALVSSVLPAGSREVLRALRTGLPLGRDGLLWIRRRQLPGPGHDGIRPMNRPSLS